MGRDENQIFLYSTVAILMIVSVVHDMRLHLDPLPEQC